MGYDMDPAATVWRAQLVYGVRMGAYEHRADRRVAAGCGDHVLYRADALRDLVLLPLPADGVVLRYVHSRSGDGRATLVVTTREGMIMACAICEAEQTLCDRCNAVAKAFNYDPVRIRKAAAILEKYERVTRPDGSADLVPKQDSPPNPT